VIARNFCKRFRDGELQDYPKARQEETITLPESKPSRNMRVQEDDLPCTLADQTHSVFHDNLRYLHLKVQHSDAIIKNSHKQATNPLAIPANRNERNGGIWMLWRSGEAIALRKYLSARTGHQSGGPKTSENWLCQAEGQAADPYRHNFLFAAKEFHFV
jgi:hypothetical protein